MNRAAYFGNSTREMPPSDERGQIPHIYIPQDSQIGSRRAIQSTDSERPNEDGSRLAVERNALEQLEPSHSGALLAGNLEGDQRI